MEVFRIPKYYKDLNSVTFESVTSFSRCRLNVNNSYLKPTINMML